MNFSVYFAVVDLVVFVAVVMLALAGPASADEHERPARSGSRDAPDLDLDRLLRPPMPGPVTLETPGGRDRETWRTRFVEVREEIAKLEEHIARTQAEIRTVSPDNWGFSPAGGGAPVDPEVLRLRAELRRDRKSLDAARARLRHLEIEAALAGVPDAWREAD